MVGRADAVGLRRPRLTDLWSIRNHVLLVPRWFGAIAVLRARLPRTVRTVRVAVAERIYDLIRHRVESVWSIVDC